MKDKTKLIIGLIILVVIILSVNKKEAIGTTPQISRDYGYPKVAAGTEVTMEYKANSVPSGSWFVQFTDNIASGGCTFIGGTNPTSSSGYISSEQPEKLIVKVKTPIIASKCIFSGKFKYAGYAEEDIVLYSYELWVCGSHSYYKCDMGTWDIYYYDSCYNKQDLKEDCAVGCEAEATTCGCTTHNYVKCDGSNLYWYNSCHQKEDIWKNCGNIGCINSDPPKCNTEVADTNGDGKISWNELAAYAEKWINAEVAWADLASAAEKWVNGQ